MGAADQTGSGQTSSGQTGSGQAGSGQPATVLRGAAVAVDGRRVVRVLVALGLVGLAVAAGLLFWAGVRHNSEVTRLRTDGVPVTVTVTGCRGLMGGSGSNLVGYECRGTFSSGGRSRSEILPGSDLHAAGSTVRLITVPGDPSLLAWPAQVRSERASWTVFVVPSVLLGAFLVLLAGALRAAPRRRSAGALVPV